MIYLFVSISNDKENTEITLQRLE